MSLYEPIYPDYSVRIEHAGGRFELEPNRFENGRHVYDLPYSWLNGTPIVVAVRPRTSPDGMFFVSNRPDDNHPSGILRREAVIGTHHGENETHIIEPITPHGELDVLDGEGNPARIYLTLAMTLGDVAVAHEQAA